MKLVLTLLCRDNADIVDAHLAFHLAAGIDFVIATDNRSVDGTDEILEAYERAGRLRLIREPSDDIRQSEWVTRMARLAAREHGADWVINSGRVLVAARRRPEGGARGDSPAVRRRPRRLAELRAAPR